TILGGGFKTGPGGKGANQAVAAARLGAETTLLVKLGTDMFGDQAAENLQREGLKPNLLLRSNASHTGVAFIVVDDNGENMIVVAGGTNNLLSVADVEIARRSIEQANVLLLQLEIPIETVEQAIKIAHQARVKVILNPAPGRPLDPSLLGMVDVLTPNETEAQIITGLPVKNLEQAEAAARQLLQMGVGTAVITLGNKGALVVTPDYVRHVPGRQVQVVDTTGAGDAFSAALAVALAENKEMVEAVVFATAAAALQVTRFGTAPAMPNRKEVLELLSAE
ncbi:MAG: ribokinase, partial [Chloroflexota bacterium]